MARILSFGSLEIARFIATDGAKRLEFFQRHLWLAPPAIAVAILGTVQPLWMLVDGFRPARQWPEAMPRQEVGGAARDGRRQRAAGLRELLVRDGAAAGARVLRAGADRAAVHSVLVDVRRLAAGAADRRRRADPQRRVSRGGWRWRRRWKCRSTRTRGPVAAAGAAELAAAEMYAHRRDFRDRRRTGDPVGHVAPLRPDARSRDRERATHRDGPGKSIH